LNPTRKRGKKKKPNPKDKGISVMGRWGRVPSKKVKTLKLLS